MKNYKTLMASALVLFGQAFCLYAQDYRISTLPAPTEPNLFNPESGLYRASMGTIRSDIDRFMDVGSFKDTSFERMLMYTGFDPQGITIGAGMKLGNLYFGVAYGGSLIQDLFSRVTNQDPSELSIDLTSTSGGETEVPGVFDTVGGRPAEANSRNEFNLFLGIWRVGIKLGFSQILAVNQPQGDTDTMEVGKTGQSFAFENSLAPSFAVGASIPIGASLFIIPELSAQLDIHQFVQGDDPILSNSAMFYSGYAQTYSEARVGADIGVEMRSSGNEFRAGAGYYLKKRINGFDIMGGAEITHVVVDNGTSETIVSTYDNLEQEITPYILYSGTINERVKFGIKLLADVRFNEYFLTPGSGLHSYGDYETHAREVYVKPELDFGGTFALLPDRFALHAGFGLNLYTFNIRDSENETMGETESSLKEILPSTRFAVGFTVNLNANTTIDMLLITSGKFDFKNEPDYNDISALRKSAQDNNKFTLFLTMRR